MKILALEFSTDRRSVAILRSDLDGSIGLLAETAMTGGRTESALLQIELCLQEAGLEREDIERIAIGLGPGSYTGIRAAIAMAQGWQLAAGVRLVGVSSVEALAAQLPAGGWLGQAAILVDAQRQEFYCERYALAADGYRRVEPLRIMSFADAQALAGTGIHLAGPEIHRWFSEAEDHFPEAAWIGRLAVQRPDAAGEAIEPIYLRPVSFVKAPPPKDMTAWEQAFAANQASRPQP
jgi:tRNA threonylcarbamoyladenosine biosynthesis protein TsaB